MIESLLFLGGIFAGSLLAWALLSGRLSACRRESAGSAAAAAQAEKQYRESAEKMEELGKRLEDERTARVTAETRLEEARNRRVEEQKLLAEAEKRLSDTFRSLAGETLDASTGSFLKLARETFDKVLAEARGDFGRRQEAIKGLVNPVSASLKQFEEHVRLLEKNRQDAYSGLSEQLKSVTSTQKELQKETARLVTALRKPQVRGRWGEMTLRRVVELAGMSAHCDFAEQVTSSEADTMRRPDMVVSLPQEREIVVDAKVSLEAYLDALSADSEEERGKSLARHAAHIRSHMNALADKRYWDQFSQAPEFVVMFIPGESFFAAAVDVDAGLIEDGLERHVVLATPTTLIALLRAVAYGWRQEQVARNARQICELGRQLHDRMRVLTGHLADIGGGLEKANASYNKAVGSLEKRILPAARRFRDLGATSAGELPHLDPVETTPRPAVLPDNSEGGEERAEQEN